MRLLISAFIAAVATGCLTTDTVVPIVIAVVIAVPFQIWIETGEARSRKIDAEVAHFRREMMQELP